MPFFVLPSYDCWQPTLTMLTVIGRLPQAWATAALKTESELYGLLPHASPSLRAATPRGQLMFSVVMLPFSNWSSVPWQGVNDGQQAALQSVESFLYLGRHIFLHLWSPSGPLHLVSILSLSSLVHVFSSSSAVQSFSDESMSSGASIGHGPSSSRGRRRPQSWTGQQRRRSAAR